MSISEAQRFEMHSSLRKVMGDDVANTLMEHLPPMGWADVARKSDIDHLDKRIDGVEKRLDGVIAGMWAMGVIMCTSFIGIFTLIATKF